MTREKEITFKNVITYDYYNHWNTREEGELQQKEKDGERYRRMEHSRRCVSSTGCGQLFTSWTTICPEPMFRLSISFYFTRESKTKFLRYKVNAILTNSSLLILIFYHYLFV